ncbi:hypothetical protein IFR04_015013 [Cadophora malorum]|uniref:Ankyrin n=1 Tax=Cadophora malorum TaxID=108018 RepID=A0A8H7VZV5_9HELO|nr:hypothetical protein IFR04_015013 [Cadophora malorum]
MELWSQLQDPSWSYTFDAAASIDGLWSTLGSSLSLASRKLLGNIVFGVLYTSRKHQLYLPEESLLVDVRRRLRVVIPSLAFQLQSSSLPWSITAYSVVLCQSVIFQLCVDGNIAGIKRLLQKSRISPFVINQHGENLLHAAARYAHADLWPEEGFAWLFASEYAGTNLEEADSEGWTLLGDAAFNFGWWTQLCVDDPAVSWQSSYLLKAGADVHAQSKGNLTPLDTFLRSCTRYHIDHATRWLKVLKESGINLHRYADQEQSIHGGDHFLKVTWDEELWKWIPTKQQVMYKYGDNADDLSIWIDDFDALSWFHQGRYDLDIFNIILPQQSFDRWQELDAKDDFSLENVIEGEMEENAQQLRSTAESEASANPYELRPRQLFCILLIFLLLNILVHIVLR